MHRGLKELHGYALEARDGRIGRVSEVLLEDGAWHVRWLVVDTGSWLEDRRTLISPAAVAGVDDEDRALGVELTTGQVEGSPPVAGDARLTRSMEADLHQFYGWAYYWGGTGAWGPAFSGGAAAPRPEPGPAAPDPGEGDPHLHDSADILGARIEARDGDVGHVADVVVDDGDWRVEHLVVDTRSWRPGGHVEVPPAAIEAVDPARGVVRLGMTRDEVRAAPSEGHGGAGAAGT